MASPSNIFTEEKLLLMGLKSLILRYEDPESALDLKFPPDAVSNLSFFLIKMARYLLLMAVSPSSFS